MMFIQERSEEHFYHTPEWGVVITTVPFFCKNGAHPWCRCTGGEDSKFRLCFNRFHNTNNLNRLPLKMTSLPTAFLWSRQAATVIQGSFSLPVLLSLSCQPFGGSHYSNFIFIYFGINLSYCLIYCDIKTVKLAFFSFVPLHEKKVILLALLMPVPAFGQIVENFESESVFNWIQSPENRWKADTTASLSGKFSLHHVFW